MDAAQTSGTARTEAFSDGVFAIAITLLVLEIRVPTEAQVRAHHDSLLLALLAGWPTYLSYLVTFVAVGTIWLNHHAFFGRLERIDLRMQWANLGLLLGVSFAPFPNSLLAEYLGRSLWSDQTRTAAAVYALVFGLGTVPWWFLWTRLAEHPDYFRAPFDRATALKERRRATGGILGYAVAIPVAYLLPVVGLVLFGAAAVFYAVTSNGLRAGSAPGGGVVGPRPVAGAEAE